jgi:hypothetical protein
MIDGTFSVIREDSNMGVQVITTTGTTLFSWPAGVNQLIVELVGAGGSGGPATGNPATGGGGQGGCYAKKTITKNLNSQITIAVPPATSTPSVSGVSGASATVTYEGVMVARAPGGRGGTAGSANSTNGAGGTGTNTDSAIGDVNNTGGNGGTGNFTSGVGGSGAGGGAAGPGGSGNDASGNTAGTGNQTVAWGDGITTRSGAGSAGVGNSIAGIIGNNYGGGGSGGKANNNTDRSGGAGAQGIAVITWTDPTDQSAFRFYENGTESGASAIDAQNTNITRDLTSGNSVLQLRTRIQELGAIAGAATDDYKLMVSKNSGSYTQILAPSTLVAHNPGSSVGNSSFENNEVGQSFEAPSTFLLRQVNVYMAKSGSPSFNVVVKIYTQTGTYGTSSLPGTLLATSDPIAASSVTSFAHNAFSFSGDNIITLSSGTKYVLVVEFGPGSTGLDDVSVSVDTSTTAGYGGDAFRKTILGVYVAIAGDMRFEILGSISGPVFSYNSSDLTEGQATTNRLGAGTGSFLAGKVTEDGEVENFQITASNYTELLFSINLIASEFSDGDTLDFKVYRNNSLMSNYSVVPRITIQKSTGTFNPTRMFFAN